MIERNGKYFEKVDTGFSGQDQKYILKTLEENQIPLQFEVPEEVKKNILITTKLLLAEIRVNEIYNDCPCAPVWVRFRWQ